MLKFSVPRYRSASPGTGPESMAQSIRRLVERSRHAYEVVLSDFENSWHVMVIRLPDALGTEARGQTLFEGLYESQEMAGAAADSFLNDQGDK